jgi:ferredoxin
MRVTINLELCEGHGMCMMAAPEIFDVPDGAEKVLLLQGEPPEALRAEAEEAAETCPVRAISVD